MLHTVEQLIQSGIARRLQALLIFADELQRIVGLVKASLQHGESSRIYRALTKVAYAQVILIYNGATVVPLYACQHIEQRTLASAIAGNEAYALSLSHAKGDALEEHQVAKRLCQAIDL